MQTPPESHSGIEVLLENHQKGHLSRREFMRYATLLGLSVTTAGALAGIHAPRPAAAAAIKRGGRIRIASPVHKVTHPAQFSWIAPSQQLRQVAEFLTFTDADNITHPYLLKNWEVSDDLKTWTLNLREGVKFNNGDEFVSDDVEFTLNQWLDESVGSSMLGMMGGYLNPSGIEKVGKYQVKLHLLQPEIAIPEHLFHYPALVLNHRTFEGDFLRAPHGTGPYTIESYREGEGCVLQRRNDYWKTGFDGQPMPYMDTVQFIDMGTEMPPQIAAIRSGDIDTIDFGDIGGSEAFQALKDDDRVNVLPMPTGQTRVLRMRVDAAPWNDNRVRTALKLCQHREKILALAYFGQGLEGQDTHVYQRHPEYCPIDTPEYNPQKARELLKEAGHPNGVNVNLAVGSGWREIVRYAEILKQDAAPAGFRINIETMPNTQYWERWTEVDLGITTWAHRPIGTMILNLGYSADANGNPASWNETRWVDKEFNQLLTQANGTIDVEARRKIFCQLQNIQQERGSIGNAFWINVWTISRKRVQNLKAHPSLYMMFDNVWLDG